VLSSIVAPIGNWLPVAAVGGGKYRVGGTDAHAGEALARIPCRTVKTKPLLADISAVPRFAPALSKEFGLG
jgi:hypothetical protein